MHKKHTIRLVLLTLATALTAHAQSSPPAPSSGLLGERYLELSAGALDLRGTSDYGFTSDIKANLPLQPGLDLGFGYSYSRSDVDLFDQTFNLDSRDHTAHVSATAYSAYRGTKPFFGAALGYQWANTELNFAGTRVFDERDDEGLWAIGTGVEIPVGNITLTPKITYQDGFKHDSAAGFTYGTEAHMWLTRTIGGFADVTFSDPTGGGTQAWTYTLGARMRF